MVHGIMVGVARVELAALCFGGTRSIQLSYTPRKSGAPCWSLTNILSVICRLLELSYRGVSEPGGIRTPDLFVRSEAL